MSFKANQDEIAKTFCIKKEVKKNNCKGKCYLAKQLKKSAEGEKKSSSNISEKQELVYPLTTLEYNFNPIVKIEKKKMRISPYCDKPKSIPFSIFHPPLV
jgi:hypothetical protein